MAMVHLVVPRAGVGYEQQGAGHELPAAAFDDRDEALAFAAKTYPGGCDVSSIEVRPVSPETIKYRRHLAEVLDGDAA